MNLATLLLLVRTRRALISNVIVGLLIFAVGWQLGRVMSPFYSASPIVFSDRECSICNSSGGTGEELVNLQDQGTSKATAVAGSKTTSTTDVKITTAQQGSAGTFVGSVNSNLFHHVECGSWQQIKEDNRVWFSTAQEAESAGYKPSKCTLDILGTN